MQPLRPREGRRGERDRRVAGAVHVGAAADSEPPVQDPPWTEISQRLPRCSQRMPADRGKHHGQFEPAGSPLTGCQSRRTLCDRLAAFMVAWVALLRGRRASPRCRPPRGGAGLAPELPPFGRPLPRPNRPALVSAIHAVMLQVPGSARDLGGCWLGLRFRWGEIVRGLWLCGARRRYGAWR